MRRALALLSLCLTAPPALAGYPEGVPGAEVGRLVRAALERAGVEVAVTDPIRPYPACDGIPMVAPQDGSWTNAQITCDAPRWQRLLRTGAGPVPRITLTPDEPSPGPMVLVLRRSLQRGEMVTAADVESVAAEALSPDQSFTDPGDVVGRRLKLSLGAGKPILARHLEPLWLVQSGAQVVLVAQAGGLVVSAPAEARDAGRSGDVVRVVNLSSGREVKAIVTGPNIVTAQTNIR